VADLCLCATRSSPLSELLLITFIHHASARVHRTAASQWVERSFFLPPTTPAPSHSTPPDHHSEAASTFRIFKYDLSI
jgi:hypothetical protein